MTRITRRLRRGGFAFSELFDASMTRSELVTMFLALLELVKLNRVRAEQEDPYGEILLRSRRARSGTGTAPAASKE